MVMILMPCFFENAKQSSKRIMSPSSSLTSSQITAAGCKPANSQRCTDASVWPLLLLRSPGTARKGNTWPGLMKSSGFDSALAKDLAVKALSWAEMPVVVPWA